MLCTAKEMSQVCHKTYLLTEILLLKTICSFLLAFAKCQLSNQHLSVVIYKQTYLFVQANANIVLSAIYRALPFNSCNKS